MKVRVIVTLIANVLDPQGQAIAKALKDLDFDGLAKVRQGKVFDLTFDDDKIITKELVDEMCEKLLVNGVVESYEIIGLNEN